MGASWLWPSVSRGSYLFARGHQVINLVKACVRFTQGRPWWSRFKPGKPLEGAPRTEVYTGSCLRDVSIIRSGVQVSNGIFTGPRRCAHTAAGQRGSVLMPGQRGTSMAHQHGAAPVAGDTASWAFCSARIIAGAVDWYIIAHRAPSPFYRGAICGECIINTWQDLWRGHAAFLLAFW